MQVVTNEELYAAAISSIVDSSSMKDHAMHRGKHPFSTTPELPFPNSAGLGYTKRAHVLRYIM